MKVFCNCSRPAHLPTTSRGKSFSVTLAVVQGPSYHPSYLGTQLYCLWHVFLDFPVLLRPQHIVLVNSTIYWVILTYSVIKTTGRIFRPKSGCQIPIETSLLQLPPATLPSYPPLALFLTDSYPATMVSQSQTHLIPHENETSPRGDLHSQLWGKQGHLDKIFCQLSWARFKFSPHYHCSCSGPSLGNTLPEGHFTTLGGRRVMKFLVKAKAVRMEGKR